MHWRSVLAFVLVGSLAVLAACATPDDTSVPDLQVREGLLLGPSDDPALDHTLDLHVPREVDADEVSEDPAIEDREVLRTEIEVLFVEDATVGEVNALLADIDGLIVGMTQGVPSYVIRIPDPGDLASLRALIDDLEARDEVLLVLEAVLVRTEPFMEAAPSVAPLQLPPGLGLDGVDRVDHHLAVRGHAAWNARQALPSLQARPWLLIADLFGDGAPNADLDAGLVSDDFADVWDSSSHGYHVLGIASAYFGESGESAVRNRITGMFPSSLRVRAADIFDNTVGTTWADLPVLMITRMRAMLDEDPNARIVINTSLNSRSLSASERERRAYLWALRVRAAGLESRTVHLTSAGNMPWNATWPAEENSIFSKAALSSMSFTIAGITFSQPRLTNTLVVENRVNTAAGTARPQPGCLNGANPGGTQLGGTISAIGTGVWSFTGPDAGTNAFTGTSMATPQVAGLAAYVWSLAPTLDAQAVIGVLLDTARASNEATTPGFTCHADTGTPVIDAFDAVLAAGGAGVRRAILDVTGSGAFTEHDLARILQEFDARDGALDYSRYDLNGSGHTGGTSTERFDLAMTGSYGTVTQAAGGVTLTFDETAVSDVDVLCYYGFSDLYAGDEALRFELLASRCGVLPTLFFPPGGFVIRSFDRSVITAGDDEYPTLPGVTFWSPQELNSLYDHYRYPLEPEGWSWEVVEGPDTLRLYGVQESRPEEFVGTLEQWSLITPSILIRDPLAGDDLPEEALTFVRIVYDDIAPP